MGNAIKNVYQLRYNLYQESSNYQFINFGTDKSKNYFIRWLNNILTPVKIPNESFFVCLNTKNVELIKNQLSYITEGANAIELRVDYFEKLTFDFIDQQIHLLGELVDIPIIYTLRSKEEWGNYQGQDFKKYIERGVYNGVSFIDVELQIKEKINRKHSLIIGSCHGDNWNLMENKTRKGFHFNKPDIIKLVGINENLQEMKVLVNELNNNNNNIVISKGVEGSFSRVENKFLTPITHDLIGNTAGGQLTYHDIISVRNTLYNNQPKLVLKNFYLIGTNIQNSPSPHIHNEAFKHYRLPYTYQLLDLKSLDNIQNVLFSKNFGGANVTTPFKKDIIKYLSSMSIEAQKIGAVNTIIKFNNKLYGDNTDWQALESIIKNSKRKFFKGGVIGTGGAACAAFFALEKQNINYDIIGRNSYKKEELRKKFKFDNFIDLNKINDTFDIIIICIPHNVSIPLQKLNNNCLIIDMSYNQNTNRKYYNKKVINGYEVLYMQAKNSFSLWTSITGNKNTEIYKKGIESFSN